MSFFINYALQYINLGVMLGLILGALLLIRPLTVRLLTPQQRVALWMVGWIPAYIPTWYAATNMLRILPVTFRSVLVPRTGRMREVPAFLPGSYDGPGAYNLALPGGTLMKITVSDALVLALLAAWAVGIAVLGWCASQRDKKLIATARQGRRVPFDDPLLRDVPNLDPETMIVRLCEGLPCSFVRRGRESLETDSVAYSYGIYLQAQLSPERLRLVLLHEAGHIRLRHCICKAYANVGLALYWWNPLVWLGYRYFCRDLELACDAAVLGRLEPGERKEYAKALVELGSGRQLWESPLSFGECDSTLRVRAAVAWKPIECGRQAAAWGMTAFLILFFLGGPNKILPPQDMPLAWERETGSADRFAQALGRGMLEQGGLDGHPDVAEVWEAPEQSVGGEEHPALWVRTRDGQWYGVCYDWQGGVSGRIKVTDVSLVAAPVLSGQTPVYQRGEGD